MVLSYYRTIASCHSTSRFCPLPSEGHFSTSPSSFYPPSTFPFPRHPYPTPYEIFHLPQTATTADVKSRYYELVKVHHPDIGFANSHASQAHSIRSPSQGDQLSNSENHFKAIVDAYELLKSPSRRRLYLNSGEGWPRSPNSSTRASRASRNSFSAERVYRPFYPSSLWDWASSDLGTQSNRYSPPEDNFPFGAQYAKPRASTFKQQWQRDGLLAKNGVFISALGCVGMLFYCFQAWKILPLLNGQFKKEIKWSAGSDPQIPEPSGDERLDQEAWHRVSRAQAATSSSSATSDQVSLDSNRFGGEASLSYPHPFAPKPYLEGFDRKSRMAAKDLKEARAAAVPARQLLKGKAIDPRS